MTTQIEIYEKVNEAYVEFLTKCSFIRMDSFCESQLNDAIEDMTGVTLDYLRHVELTAKKIDKQRGYEKANPEKQYDKYEAENE